MVIGSDENKTECGLIVNRTASGPNWVSVVAIGTITREALLPNDSPESALDNECFSRNLVLSLAECAGIDSSGVSWLIRMHRHCQAEHGRLILHSIPLSIQRTIKLLNLERLFHLVENEAATMQLLQDDMGS